MCGRFTLTTPAREIADVFGVEVSEALEPRFNVAPGQRVVTVSATGSGRVLVRRRWGLVPGWARDPRIGARLVNARLETAASRPAFRDALRRRRCLVPADGFYEWADRGAGPRQPYHLVRPDRGCFAMAGLFERWRQPDGSWLETCTLLTTAASPEVAAIHPRMPVVLPPADWAAWLDPRSTDPSGLPRAGRAPQFVAIPVSRRVNRPEYDDAGCIEPLPGGMAG